MTSGGLTRPDGDPVPVTLGLEPAGEVMEVGDEVVGLDVGDHVVINPMIVGAGRLGTGGSIGAMAENV